MSVREIMSTRVTRASALKEESGKTTSDRIQAIRARKRCMSSLQRGHSLHHYLPKPTPLMQILYIGVRSNFSLTMLSFAGSNRLELSPLWKEESGARTDWNTTSQSWLYPSSSSTPSFANFSLKGGGMEMKRLTGALAVAPSEVTSSMVKSGDSRSFFFDLSSSFSFCFSFSSFFFPGSETSSSMGATESSRVDV